ncbi:glycosyltransferase family 2 protein [Thermoflavifilum thermophilum]|uniref:Glycosyl transferase family 2 n=1 Tax=Thermoflavifilum thermophilum TaxID=1393122 RepID=A0A1I7NBJ9_9BACT|nr:glycosyltransferase family 2 protein [Thermoflavifilum thermophilum]SFV32045.1 Glycosyl transferase family 2 [Thermoflavifilum thermophilum]
MPSNPTVSVLIPFYQAGRFIGEAIESVVMQTYRDWELLLIDDGTTDESAQIARQWAERYPDRIYLLNHPDHSNHGLPAARNLGLSHARGRYVALLDADDVWLPEKLETQIRLARRFPECGLFGEGSLYWYSWSGQSNTGQDEIIYPGIRLDARIDPPEAALTLYPLGKGAAPCPSSLLMKTETLKKLDGFETAFSGPYMVFEDQAFLMKFYLQEPVYFAATCLNRYRQRPDSLMGSWQQNHHEYEIHRYYFHWLEHYLKAHFRLPDPRVEKALRQARSEYSFWKQIKNQIFRFIP